MSKAATTNALNEGAGLLFGNGDEVKQHPQVKARPQGPVPTIAAFLWSPFKTTKKGVSPKKDAPK